MGYRRVGYATGYPYAGYNGFAGYSHLIGKRDAEAEPKAEADADALLYTAAYAPYTTHGAYFNHGAFPYRRVGYATGYPYAGYNGFAGYSHLIGKRDADADAEPLLYTAGLYAHPYSTYHAAYPHGVVATPFGLTHSSNVGLCFNNEGAQVSC